MIHSTNIWGYVLNKYVILSVYVLLKANNIFFSIVYII